MCHMHMFGFDLLSTYALFSYKKKSMYVYLALVSLKQVEVKFYRDIRWQ